jgi:hypothetical protein
MTRFQLSTGALELLKWLGVLLMFGDHTNTGLFQRELPALAELGCLGISDLRMRA